MTFLVQIEKNFKKIDREGNEFLKTISSRLKFIDSTRFLASSLSNLVKNLAEGFHEIKRKHGDDKKM